MIIETNSAKETYELGLKIGREAKKGQVYTMVGDLGVGKTVFTQGMADGLEITEPISSPTFTIVQVYDEGRLPFYHFDVYRIGDISEMDEIGYEDYIYGEGISLIEWANLIEEILPENRIELTIEKDLEKGFDYRKITIEERGVTMRILALDSSGLVATVAILEDKQTIAEYTMNYKKTHSQTLLPMLDEIVKMTEFDLSTIDAIAVAGGPGSFTGLRIGSATAKGLGLALKKPLIHIPTLDGMAYNLFGSTGLICPIMDARRNQVYTGLYRFENNEFKVVEEQMAVSVDELIEKLNQHGETVTFLGDGVPVYKEKLENGLNTTFYFAPAHMNRQRASAVGALGMKYFAEGKIETAMEHQPDYLRLSQAERERAEKEKMLNFREITEDDIDAVAELEKAVFLDAWTSSGIYETFCQNQAFITVAEEDGKIEGYCIIYYVLDEGEIARIAVDPEKRRRGAGKSLLDYTCSLCREKGVTRLLLDVRESNETARRFYEKYGFTEDGIRKNFYEMPVEHAVLMSKTIG